MNEINSKLWPFLEAKKLIKRIDENKKKESELKSEEVVSSDESEKGEIKNNQTSEDQKPIGEEIIDNEISKKKE